MKNWHSFHIPVMGIGYTLETPLKVSQYGIDSVISLVDDILLEKLRKMYCAQFEMPYQEITNKIEDFRAKRITAYLNLVNQLSTAKFERLKKSTTEKGAELKNYLKLLPTPSSIRNEFKNLTEKLASFEEIGEWIKDNLTMGSIDVNIMTKVDKVNYWKKKELPTEYNDAHAALRGFANSELSSSLILSAGMNPRLYGYIEQFSDFYPTRQGDLKKKIVLKVSDYRSALIQGKYLAKKGLWVSEFRIESGLNCGGHAFATDGFLLGPVLAEFRDNRQKLTDELHTILTKGLLDKDLIVPEQPLPLKLTAQGGVGTAEEHQFLMDEYQLDSVGWGSPFLLVPEATTVDDETMEKLVAAKESDLYLSGTSPLGVPFNTLKGNTKDDERLRLIDKGRPGSACPKKFVSLNYEFTDEGICTASRQYQVLKLKELELQNLPDRQHQSEYNKIIEKSCICVGLGTSALLANDLDTKIEGDGVSICPGPNMAYFSKAMSLKDITDHIYGRTNVIARNDRPNMFVKELGLYMDYLQERMHEAKNEMTIKQKKYLTKFANNLQQGIQYYQQLFSATDNNASQRISLVKEFNEWQIKLKKLSIEIG